MSAGRPSKLETRAWEMFKTLWDPGLADKLAKDRFDQSMKCAQQFERFFAMHRETERASSAAVPKSSPAGSAQPAQPTDGPIKPSSKPSPRSSQASQSDYFRGESEPLKQDSPPAPEGLDYGSSKA